MTALKSNAVAKKAQQQKAYMHQTKEKKALCWTIKARKDNNQSSKLINSRQEHDSKNVAVQF